MDQLRNFTQTNRSSVVNIIYIVAAFVLVYYVVMYYFGSDVKDVVLMKNKMTTADAKKLGSYIIAKKDDAFRLGPEYTISFWIYISDYNQGNSDKIQAILSVFDEGSVSATNTEALLFVGLHPTKNQMIIRSGDGDLTNGTDDTTLKWTQVSGPTPSYSWGGASADANQSGLKPCDVMDIDVQRWLNVTISINGRIMDVYLDGKLARSCIMPNIQKTSNKSQMIQLFESPSIYAGYISGLQVSNYAVTPDVIYGRYQAGPYFSAGFLDYLVDKLGIRISYQGTGETSTTSFLDMLGVKPT